MNSYDKYDTFWKRWLASVIDGLVFLPLAVAVSINENSTNTTAFLLFSILHVFLFTLYVVPAMYLYIGRDYARTAKKAPLGSSM